MSEDFDGVREPMRALRDLIITCEMTFGVRPGEQEILRRAQDGFTALRALLGDIRPAEDIGEALMIEPARPALPAHPALPAQICAGRNGCAGSAVPGICLCTERFAPADFAIVETALADALAGDAGACLSAEASAKADGFEDFPLIDGPLTRLPA